MAKRLKIRNKKITPFGLMCNPATNNFFKLGCTDNQYHVWELLAGSMDENTSEFLCLQTCLLQKCFNTFGTTVKNIGNIFRHRKSFSIFVSCSTMCNFVSKTL